MIEKIDIEEIKQFMNENLLTKKEAMEITGQSLTAFDQAVATGRLKPFFEKGEGRGTVRLYLKADVERYNQERLEHLKKFGRKL